jgi:CrcB protein
MLLALLGGAIGSFLREAAGRAVHSHVLMVLVGGATGTYLRYTIGKWFNSQPWGEAFPFGTLFINVTGSFVLAVAAVVIFEKLEPRREEWYMLVGVGFCGGYTTFSTFAWETFRLIRDGSWWYALANSLGSVLASLAGVFLGVILTELIFQRR